MRLDFGENVRPDVLRPPPRLLANTDLDTNNNSVVVRLSCGRFSLLLTGDVQQEGERALLTLGSAICAAVGAGQYPTLAEAAEQMVKIKTEVEPDPANKEVYDFYFQKYVASYPGLKDLMHEVSTRVQSQD